MNPEQDFLLKWFELDCTSMKREKINTAAIRGVFFAHLALKATLSHIWKKEKIIIRVYL